MLEQRLNEIDSDLKSLNAQVELAKKEKSQVSPGLKQAILTLLKKQGTMIVKQVISLSMFYWREADTVRQETVNLP